MVQTKRVLFGLIIPALQFGCGGARAPVESAPPPDTGAPVAAVPERSEASADVEPSEAEANAEDLAAADIEEPPQPEPEPSMAPRQIKYVMSNGGLRIEVAGVRLVPHADPLRRGRGWGVRVRVEASALDGQGHSLLNPARGPLAFAGRVVKDGKSTHFGDKREGDAELVLAADQARTLERAWPDEGQNGLVAGQTLELEVGLWGLGDSAETRRPVRKLLRLKMVAGKNQPQPVILPPDAAEGAG